MNFLFLLNIKMKLELTMEDYRGICFLPFGRRHIPLCLKEQQHTFLWFTLKLIIMS